MGGQSASTPQDGASPWISAPSDPRDMPDPLIEGLKYAAGTMGYGPNAAAPSAPKTMQAPAPSPATQQQPTGGSEYTIPPDPLIETLKWLVGSSNAGSAPKRK